MTIEFLRESDDRVDVHSFKAQERLKHWEAYTKRETWDPGEVVSVRPHYRNLQVVRGWRKTELVAA